MESPYSSALPHYKVVRSDGTPANLEDKINQFAREGYEPIMAMPRPNGTSDVLMVKRK